MGAGEFLAENLFKGSNTLRKLTKIDRQYFMQGLALGEDLSQVFKAVHSALAAGSDPGLVQISAKGEFDKAAGKLCEYVEKYGIDQKKNLRQSDKVMGESILQELVKAKRGDKYAAESLKRIEEIHEKELTKVQAAKKYTISICYWPEKPFINGKTQSYLHDKFVKVEKGTVLEVLLLRVLTSPFFSETKNSKWPVSLDRRPELYEKLPETVDDYDRLAKDILPKDSEPQGKKKNHKVIRSLDPYQMVDDFKKKPIHIILSLREQDKKYLETSNGECLPLLHDWTNAWCLQDDPTWVVYKRNDPYSSLCKISIVDLKKENITTSPFSVGDSPIPQSNTGSEFHPLGYEIGYSPQYQSTVASSVNEGVILMPVPTHTSALHHTTGNKLDSPPYTLKYDSSTRPPAFPMPAQSIASVAVAPSTDKPSTRKTLLASDLKFTTHDTHLTRESPESSSRGPSAVFPPSVIPSMAKHQSTNIGMLPSSNMPSQVFITRMKTVPDTTPVKKKGWFATFFGL